MAQITLCYRGLSEFRADQVATAVGVHLNYLHAYEKNFGATTQDEVKFSDVKNIVIEESYRSKMPAHLGGQFNQIMEIDRPTACELRRTIITKSILSIVTFDIFENIRLDLRVIDEKYSENQEDTKFVDIKSIYDNIEPYKDYSHSVFRGQTFQLEEDLKKVLQRVLSDRFDDAAITAAELKAQVEKGFRNMESGFQNTVDKEYLDSALERLVTRLKPDARSPSRPGKAS